MSDVIEEMGGYLGDGREFLSESYDSINRKETVMSKQTDKKLYWVKFIEQSDGAMIDTYFTAHSISELDEHIADILEIKVIQEVIEL